MTLWSRLLIVTGISSALTVLLMFVYWEPESAAQPLPLPAVAPLDGPSEPVNDPEPDQPNPASPVRQVRHDRDDAETKRVMRVPHEIGDLSLNVQHVLAARDCAVPASAAGPNLVWGEFRQPGQHDLAVLCVRETNAALFVFWNGDASTFDESPALDFLPGLEARTLSRDDVLPLLEADDAIDPGMPRVIRHDGIELASSCCSEALYWHRGRWRLLPSSN